MGDFLAALAPAWRIKAAPAKAVIKQRPQLAPRDAVAHRRPVGGLPGVGAGAARQRHGLPQLRAARHRVEADEEGGPLVVFHREACAAVVHLQAHFPIQQARRQHHGAVEAAEIRGGEGQRLHRLAVHIHQPHAHRLAGYEAAFYRPRFGENAFEVERLPRPVNGAVGEEKGAALSLFGLVTGIIIMPNAVNQK